MNRVYLLGVLWLGACTSVLGIEEASLDPGSAASGPTRKPQVKPTLACDEPTDACKQCREGCALETCLADNDCRDGLFDYRSCLGANCLDEDLPVCLETFVVDASTSSTSSTSSTFPANCVCRRSIAARFFAW